MDEPEEITIKASPRIIKAIAKELKNQQEISYSVEEVAKIVGKSARVIRNHIKIGLLVATKTGKPWEITQENLNNYKNGK